MGTVANPRAGQKRQRHGPAGTAIPPTMAPKGLGWTDHPVCRYSDTGTRVRYPLTAGAGSIPAGVTPSAVARQREAPHWTRHGFAGMGRQREAPHWQWPIPARFRKGLRQVKFLDGTNPYRGVSSPQKRFPSVLPFSEATDWIEQCGPSGVLLGVDGTGNPISVDLDSESPHVLISAPTGRGKSAVARSFAVQRLMRGDLVIVLDVKRHSHRWSRDLTPNVRYAKDAQDIGGVLAMLGREVHIRNRTADEWEGPLASAPVGPRIIVVFEEMNATMAMLKTLDRRLPEGEYTALQGLMDISFMGRAVKMHLVSFAQLASYRASGGSEIIEQYATRVLIGHSAQAWRWLASDCGKPLTAPEEPGRGVVCYGGKARECQLLWVPEEDASELVLSSVPAQRRARALSRGRRNLPEPWRKAIGR